MENRIFPALRAFKPELIILSAGFDAAKGDVGNSKLDTGKGGIDLTVKDYERLTESTTFYNHVLLFMSCFVYFFCLIQFLLLDWTFQLILDCVLVSLLFLLLFSSFPLFLLFSLLQTGIVDIAKLCGHQRIVSCLEGGYGKWSRGKNGTTVLDRSLLAENVSAHVHALIGVQPLRARVASRTKRESATSS